jgi:hypothetical protein
MEIKLQDYSLISNEWIDERIKLITNQLNVMDPTTNYSYSLSNQLLLLNELKQQLIPSEKLATFSFNAGERYGWDSQKSIANIDEMREIIPFKSKEDFLTSEIEI